MKGEQIHEQTTKQFLNSTPIPKIAHYGPKSQKMTPTLSQNQMPELKETQKMKVVQLHEQTPKHLSNQILNRSISLKFKRKIRFGNWQRSISSEPCLLIRNVHKKPCLASYVNSTPNNYGSLALSQFDFNKSRATASLEAKINDICEISVY